MMNDISLHLLDIAQNSLSAGSRHIALRLCETDDDLTVTVADDGEGIPRENIIHAAEAGFTTKADGRGGMGLALLKQAAESTGGSFFIGSRHISEHARYHGTSVTARFIKASASCPPTGDTVSSVCALMACLGDTEMRFTHSAFGDAKALDTAEMRAVLGKIPLSDPEVILWVKKFLGSRNQE